MNEEYVSINPHKSIYRKLGSSSHGFNESIAELIDNSIDARTIDQKNGEKLIIKITIKDDYCIIEDNASGMSLKETQKAITLALSEKTDEDLGKFGFGLKTACLSIGDKFELTTSKINYSDEYKVVFDVDKFENDSAISFSKFPITKNISNIDSHFTKIVISKIKIRLYNKASNLRKDIGKRYRAFLKNNVDIFVNNELCVSDKINWSDGYPLEINEITEYGPIAGVVGLMKESSQQGFYGFDLYRNGRMIKTYSKFGFSEHPTLARIAGELNLNFVPVTHEKNKFIEESKEYIVAEESIKKSEFLKNLIKKARKSSEEEKATDPRTLEKIGVRINNIDKAFRERDIKELLNPNVNKSNSFKDNNNDLSDINNSKLDIEIEKRNPPENESTSNLSIDGNKKRTPKKTHLMPRKIKIGNKEFNWEHNFVSIDGGPIKYYELDKSKGLIINTNTAFLAYSMAKDTPYYVTQNVIDSIAELYCKDNNENTIDKFNEIKTILLDKVSVISLQIEEDFKKKSILTKNTNCLICGEKLRSNSLLTKYCNKCYKINMKESASKYYKSEKYKEKKMELRKVIKQNDSAKADILFEEFLSDLK